MRPVGVEARLEPDPSVSIFSIWKFLRDMRLHRVPACHGHVNFARTGTDSIFDRVTADICGGSTGAYQRDFGWRFHHALLHRRLCQVDLSFWGQKAGERCGLDEGQVITLIADHTPLTRDGRNCAPVVIALPIGIGNVVAKAAAPGLAGVYAGGNGDAVGCGDNQPIGTAKGAI